MKRWNIFFVFCFVYLTVYGQDIDNFDSSFRNHGFKKHNRELQTSHLNEPAFCEEAEEVEALSLRCDTVEKMNGASGSNRYLYFDNEGRLRKYWANSAIYDGSNEYYELRSYYDSKGKLVYMDYSDGCNCDDGSGHLVVRNGRVFDYKWEYDCGCCENDDYDMHVAVTEFDDVKIEKQLRNVWRGRDYSSFIDTAILLEVLTYEYKYDWSYGSTSKEAARATILDDMIERGELLNDTLVLNEKGRYWIIMSYDHTKSIRKCYLSISLEEGHESIWLYYDASGHLYYLNYHNSSEYIDGKSSVRESILMYVDAGIIVGGEHYRNAELDNTVESSYEEWDRFLKSLYGSKVDKTPYLKKDLSPFLNTKNLKEYIGSIM